MPVFTVCLLLLFATISILPTAETSPDANFHLYLLVGQSNMAGRGKPDEESTKPPPRVLMLTKDLQWVPASDPMHFDKPTAGVGPGVTFGRCLAEANDKIRIGLIPCAIGGTSINVWKPRAATAPTHPWEDMLARTKAAVSAG
ncbi:MAG: sialate O-acetylesterase, partial [Planctomycetota bacterium]